MIPVPIDGVVQVNAAPPAKPTPQAGLRILNGILHGMHLFVIVFSVVGWMIPATRAANLVLLLLILFSWYGLGPMLGGPGSRGYCAITDLQWRLRRRMGLTIPSWGYMKFLIDRIARRSVNEHLIERITVTVFFACLIASAAATFL